MDLFAYSQIEKISHIAEENGISVPRLRGYRLMSDEEKTPGDSLQEKVWNKYAGRDDVLLIHARIGGANWIDCGGESLTKEPWFLEKVDDEYDCTYCDIYAKINPKTAKKERV